MPNSYKFSAIAQKELEESAGWYEKQLSGLGVEFIDAIYDSADIVTRNAEAYPVKAGTLREYVVKRFPFVLVYRYNKAIQVVNIVHVFTPVAIHEKNIVSNNKKRCAEIISAPFLYLNK